MIQLLSNFFPKKIRKSHRIIVFSLVCLAIRDVLSPRVNSVIIVMCFKNMQLVNLQLLNFDVIYSKSELVGLSENRILA